MKKQDGIDIIKKCLSILSYVSVDKVDIELGNPDSDLLPLNI